MKPQRQLTAFCIFTCLLYLQNVTTVFGDSENSFFKTVVTSQDGETGHISYSNGSDVQLKPYKPTYIDVKIVEKPHNLFIGRCMEKEEQLHAQKIVVNNDGKSQLSAIIRFNVATDKEVAISCVNVYDEAPGIGAYPSYAGGGVGYNYVEIGVVTKYGKGFAFYVEIFGRNLQPTQKQQSPTYLL